MRKEWLLGIVILAVWGGYTWLFRADDLVEGTPAKAAVLVGKKATVVRDAWGCKSEDVNDRLSELAAQRDEAAFIKFLEGQARAGECRQFQPGTEVVVERSDLLRELYRVRLPGELEGYWVTKPSVER